MVAVDLGARRIGVARTDPSGVVALPHSVLDRSGDASDDRRRLAGLVAELGADVVVVGLPVSMSGAEGRATAAARAEVSALRSLLDVPVELFDERLTTVEARRRRRERDLSVPARSAGRRLRQRPLRRPPGVSRLAPIDAEAAAILLEAYLKSRRGRGDPAACAEPPGSPGGEERTT
ncbi:MAG: Holliday junction resolvase RuvX [Acidimicrobiales bacterium]